MKPKVSVLVITYNQANYIGQALDSVLAQNRDFELEIVIGDDCSSDTTREIINTYQAKHPTIIKPIFPAKNLGPQLNFINTYQHCKGDYIAMLEGDDYWCDNDKLLTQIHFLDAHPEYSLCFTNNYFLYTETGKIEQVVNADADRDTYQLEDLLQRNFIATQTTVFKNNLRNKLPDWFSKVYVGDWPLHILNAQYGKIKHFDRYTAVYRVHSQGIWSKLKSVQQDVYKTQVFEYLKETLPIIYHRDINLYLKKTYYGIIINQLENRQFKDAQNYLRLYRGLLTGITDIDYLKLYIKFTYLTAISSISKDTVVG